MGYAARERKRVQNMLDGLKVAVDVQHLYRDGKHARDRGAVFTLADGSRLAEADCALHYAQAAIASFRAWGIPVLSNEPAASILVGPYSRRQSCAAVAGCSCYLACHINAGRGLYAQAAWMSGAGSSALASFVTAELKESLAEIVAERLVPLESSDRGAVCIEGFTRGPAVLLEPLFGDRPEHQPLLALAGLERVGQAIARGVVNWWGQRKETPA